MHGHNYLERPLSIWKFEKHVILDFEFRKNIYTKMTRNQHQVKFLKKNGILSLDIEMQKKKKFANI